MAKNLRSKTTLWQKRARQLQLSAEVTQQTSASLNLDKLLHETVYLIRDHFGFYHVTLFLLDEGNQYLILRESTGEVGERLKAQQHRVALTSNAIISWAATKQKARIASDVQRDPVYMPEPLLPGTRSELALPLIARGQLLGVLDVQSQMVNAFQEEDVAILQIMANQVAVNIDNARLFAQTEVRLDEAKKLFNFNTLLSTTLDVGEIYRRAARAFTEQLKVTRCAISSWEPEANTVTLQVEFIHDEENDILDRYDLEPLTYDLSLHSGTQRLLQTHEPLLRDVYDPNLEESERQILLKIQQTRCLEIPLVRGQVAIGIVELFRNDKQATFSSGETQRAQIMANQTAVALDNARLTSEAHGRLAQLSMLNRMSTILSLAPSLKDIFEGARREILSLIEATGMSILLLTPEGDKLDWIYGFEYGQEVDLTSIPPLPITQGFSGHVARTREVLLINKQLEEMSNQFQSLKVGAETSTWLGLPLIVANKLIGVLSVENEHDSDAFGERDIELLKTIAGPLAIAINNLLQFEAVQNALAAQSEQRLQLQTAAEVAAATTSILDSNALMQRAVTLIKERFSLYYVGLFLVVPETNQAILKAGTGEAGRAQIRQRRQLPVGGRSLIGGATGDGVPRITQDVMLDKEWLPNPHLPNTRSELALPLRVRGHIIGALTVQSTTPNAFSSELISTLQTMSDQLAIAIENAQLLSRAEARTQHQQALNQISTRLHRSADVNEIINVGLRALSEHLSGTKVELILGEPGTSDA
jgi:GAF domain-containing protein